jgi:hypothetical protein
MELVYTCKLSYQLHQSYNILRRTAIMPAMISLPSLRGNVKHGTPERIINQLCGPVAHK